MGKSENLPKLREGREEVFLISTLEELKEK
jgi:hypothetical protein